MWTRRRITQTCRRLRCRRWSNLPSAMSLNTSSAAKAAAWTGDAGEGFFRWELDQGLLSEEMVCWARTRYADYKAGSVSEDDMCGEMVTLHRGLNEDAVQRAATVYFDEHLSRQIFLELRELMGRLQQTGCDVWVVSSTNEWVIRAGMRHFGIPDTRILAAAIEIDNVKITER